MCQAVGLTHSGLTEPVEESIVYHEDEQCATPEIHASVNMYGFCDIRPKVCIMYMTVHEHLEKVLILTLTVLVATIDAQWEGMGDVGSVRYEPALLPPCPTIRVLSYSN